MADLFSMTAPLMIRLPTGEERVIAHHFRHPEGMLYFDLFWHEGQPEQVMHVVKGEVKGDGPWKIGEHVINVLGCHGSQSELAMQYGHWQNYLLRADVNYPPPQLVNAIALKMGAVID